MLAEDAALGSYDTAVDAALDALGRDAIVERIWQRDHTVWSQDPTEITDRLGWLTCSDEMRQRLPELRAFAAEVREAGIRHVVLLGMGGSALAPEVYRATFGVPADHPQFTMLDSTVPGRVREVSQAINPSRTLFIVASKSGSTVEVLTFYRYFRGLVERAVAVEDVGRHFVAITDEGTVLHQMAEHENFRRAFLNPPTIGGRFSGLSLFGLVPAALMGIDLDTFFDGVDAMRAQCGPEVPTRANPAASLGAVMGALAQQGVDKLTLITSPGLNSFGLWTEQMLGESLGKGGKGIVPISSEPHVPPSWYGDDRLFVYLQLEGDHNSEVDEHVESLRAAGFPTVQIAIPARERLGGELFRWAFATAIAGHILGVQPFDQPNVQQAKDIAVASLEEYRRRKRLPSVRVADAPHRLLAQAKPHDYVAVLAYLPQSRELDQAIEHLRRSILGTYHVATAVGYGPRYLHSTGQLHKGGPNSGLFLQLVAPVHRDIPVPGQPYTFGVLAEAQAQGDIGALQAERRRIARLDLGADPPAALHALADAIGAG